MDQIKIGKFIAECRKGKGLTQMQLAEKMNITDRAVSKWETGRAIPDASIMLELCNILGITVNDLLSGEIVTVDNYNKNLEKNLLEMVKAKEEADRKMLRLEIVIGVLSVVVLLGAVLVGAYLPMKDWMRVCIIIAGFAISSVGIFSAMRIEQVAGYYECGKCHHKYVPTSKAIWMSMHMGRTRYMKCPKCHRKSWQKKVISKD